MSTHMRPPTVDPPQSNNEVQKEKASWDLKATECFIHACLDQVAKGERQGTSFTKKGWKGIQSIFNEETGRKYNKPKLQNRYDNLRKEWKVWYKLFGKETGLGWDHLRHTFAADDEWWERKQLENPMCAKFKNKGLPFAPLLTTLFKDVVATGELCWAPTSGVLPPGLHDDNDDVYRPSLENIGLDMEEGSGDSEDDSIGARNEFANIDLNVSQGAASQRSGEKRKRVTSAKKTSKKKQTPAATLADAVSVIAESHRSRNDKKDQGSISEVLAELRTIPEIANNTALHTKCCSLLMFKPAREVFIALRDDEEKRLHWIKDVAYNPLPFMKQSEYP